MRQGPSATEFEVESGEEVTIRVVAVGTGQLEVVSDAFVRIPDDTGPGHLYRGTIHGAVGQNKHVQIDCAFVVKNTPRSSYRFELAGSLGGRFSPPPVLEPLEFPNNVKQFVAHGFSFEIAA